MTTQEQTSSRSTGRQRLEQAVIRFAGDSGDGMQLAGGRLTRASAVAGNDLATLPDYPAEIRAPAGTLAGVSGFQIRISSFDIHTPGDAPDVLVAMNPAALKANIDELVADGLLLVNSGAFTEANLAKAGYETNPLEDDSLAGRRVIAVDMLKLIQEVLNDLDLKPTVVQRSKNVLALGMLCWLFNRPLEPTFEWLEEKFGTRPELVEANRLALQAGWNYADITSLFEAGFEVPPADLPSGTYRNIMGNQALSLGLVAAAKRSGLDLVYCSYPITPASDILHSLAVLKHQGVITYQCEDEIAAVGSAIGASYAGALGVTGTSGPGLSLKTEAIGLAMMAEVPLVVVDVQRAGPSTGMPTKPAQSDLLMALYGRHGESPIPVLAARTPSECFDAAMEACETALRHMTPVILLSDGYLANGSEPWLLPDVDGFEPIELEWRTEPDGFLAYARDQATGARPRVRPGTPGLEHRIGGLEKEPLTGGVSYEPLHHEEMVRQRAAKVASVADFVDPFQVEIGPSEGRLLVLAWGSTYGASVGGTLRAASRDLEVSMACLRWISPFPHGLAEGLAKFDKVLVPETNSGQLALLLRSMQIDTEIISMTKIQGTLFSTSEILDRIREELA